MLGSSLRLIINGFLVVTDMHNQDVKESADGGSTTEGKHTNKGVDSKSVSEQHEIGYPQVCWNYK